jgi:hypothetical protein
MTLKTLLLGATAALGLALSALPAQAYIFGSSGGTAGSPAVLTLNGATTVTAFDMGWYNATGQHTTNNDNYILADPSDVFGQGYNDFFAFDLSQLSGAFTSATITIQTADVSVEDTVALGAYSESASALLNGLGGVTAYNGLGSGALYGSRAYTFSDSQEFRTITLNAAFLADLNQAVGSSGFVIGGTSQDYARPGAGSAAPEPAAWAMMLMGFFGLGAALRSRRLTGVAA